MEGGQENGPVERENGSGKSVGLDHMVRAVGVGQRGQDHGGWMRSGELKEDPAPASLAPFHLVSLCLHTETGMGAICPYGVHATPVSWGTGWLR